MKKNLYKKIVYRFNNDSIEIFFFRVIFFLTRKSLEIFDFFYYEFYKLGSKVKYNKHVVKEINQIKMNLDLNDSGISKDLLLAGIREPRHTDLIKDIVKPGDIVFDIGANIGYYALLESRLVGPNGKIYAIEPVPTNVELLKNNIKLNNFNNIEVFQLAISDKDGENQIYLSEKSNWCSMINNSEKTGSIPVKTAKLDTFVRGKKFPDLVRMDVEGYEIEIINGMDEMLSASNPLKVIIEMHCCMLNDLGFGLIEKMEKYGFKIGLLFRDRSVLMLNKPDIIKNFYYFLGKKINGVYEFSIENISFKEIFNMRNILKEEVFHFYFVKN